MKVLGINAKGVVKGAINEIQSSEGFRITELDELQYHYTFNKFSGNEMNCQNRSFEKIQLIR